MTLAETKDSPAGWPATGTSFGPWDFGPFGPEVLTRYAEVSGDDNPLHLDIAVATAAGLEAPPIQGMLMMSCLEPAVRRWRDDLDIVGLSAKFLRPVLTGERIEISGRVVRSTPAELVLRLTTRRADGEVAMLAEATVVRAPRAAAA